MFGQTVHWGRTWRDLRGILGSGRQAGLADAPQTGLEICPRGQALGVCKLEEFFHMLSPGFFSVFFFFSVVFFFLLV